ncbi:STAS domain-containing protein [Thermodesulfobacteriota bacterium]
MPKTKKKPTKKTFKPGKDIIASMVGDFRKKLQKVLEQGIKDITIDFSNVAEVDSMGIGVLIAACNSLENEGGTLKAKNVSENIYLLFKIMKLDQKLVLL